MTESDRAAQLLAFKLHSSITIGRDRDRERGRERERGVAKDRSNTKFGPSFMWTAIKKLYSSSNYCCITSQARPRGIPGTGYSDKDARYSFLSETITKPRRTSLSLPYGSWYQEFSWDLWHTFYKHITKIDWTTHPLSVLCCTKSTKVYVSTLMLLAAIRTNFR